MATVGDYRKRKNMPRQMESSNAYLLDLVNNNVIDIADMDSQTDDIPKPVSVDACCQGMFRIDSSESEKNQVKYAFHLGRSVYGLKSGQACIWFAEQCQ